MSTRRLSFRFACPVLNKCLSKAQASYREYMKTFSYVCSIGLAFTLIAAVETSKDTTDRSVAHKYGLASVLFAVCLTANGFTNGLLSIDGGFFGTTSFKLSEADRIQGSMRNTRIVFHRVGPSGDL